MLILVFDYLLWMVMISFVGGIFVYYFCDEEDGW